MNLDLLSAPAMVTWQLTRACNLACLHCCTGSAPGNKLDAELGAEQAMSLARDIVRAGVPKVMLCGGEPLLAPHFLELARFLGSRGVSLKIETNGQKFDAGLAARLASLPITAIQISLDADTQQTYAKQRPGASLSLAHEACRAVAAAGMPLEVTFAPTRLNLREAEAVIERAADLGAVRFNTGMLMRLGTADKLWRMLSPSREEYAGLIKLLRRKKHELRERMRLCFTPWSLARALKAHLRQPPATMLVLPDGQVKVSAALPFLCADLARQSIAEAWDAYRRAWKSRRIARSIEAVLSGPDLIAKANGRIPLHGARLKKSEKPISALAAVRG